MTKVLFVPAFNKYDPVTGAFLPWHRAHLLAFETLIGSPIPFWNFFAADSTDSSSDASGLPTAFLDETYTGQNGEILRNPLRFAPVPRSDLDSLDRTPIRDPLLTIGTADARALKTDEAAAYLARIDGVLTLPEPPARPALDWLLGLPYGAVRTWVGGDMGLTLRAAYDPLYWSFIANVDRISGQLMEAYTPNSTEVLKPFARDESTGNIMIVENEGPDTKYVTIGDIVQMQIIGSVGRPAFPDYVGMGQ
ncbi:hypothetical protein BDZ94DRAFT_254492 [Collybia nuda]|uniref:Tyrosinase copper-binding domain-containing protein n=1 Tax=Collybia nuda TaxID=64659 RepID=A0A9P6CDR8_9AGAR|nr:hypothetical protein BDZ94DRAFT_254492 [Collybia nuda]